jgi:two-component system sensor histidine kinase BaeS
MRWTIASRVFLALVLTSAITLALNTLLGRWSFQRDFLAYKAEQDIEMLGEIATGFVQQYQQHGDWSALEDDPASWRQLVRNSSPRPAHQRGSRRPDERFRDRPPPRRDRFPENGPPSNDPLNIVGRLALFDDRGSLIAGSVASGIEQSMPLIVAGTQAGELRLAPPVVLTEEIDLRFARGQSRSLMISAFAVSIIAILAAFILARQMTRPVKLLVNRARTMTAGEYSEQVFIAGNSELTDLAQDFNKLARTLEDNRRSRRQWISDISHELRTPLAILTAEIQALEDGVREFNESTRNSLALEIQRLNRLVNDLYELSASDEGTLSMHPSLIDLEAILAESVEGMSDRIKDHGLSLEFEKSEAVLAVPTILTVQADATRLSQLFANLIENSLRYTDAPGILRVRCDKITNDSVDVVFEDSAPGVPENLLPKLFQRLFRVEQSRGRHSGGSGLGLAICKAIAEAHDATMSAASSDLGGLCVRITFPLAISADTESGSS